MNIAPLRGAPVEKPWEGSIARKPWHYQITACIPVLDTPEELGLVIELLRLQTIRPFVIVVDTGSTPENLAATLALAADDVEVHSLRFNGRRHPSDFPAVALDFAFASVQTEWAFCTHSDVFPRRRDLLEWLLSHLLKKRIPRADTSRTIPCVGYQMTERPHEHWQQMVSHTCTLYHMPTLDGCHFVWNFRALCAEQGLSPALDPDRPNWPDTEVAGNYALWEHELQALLIGQEKNFERTLDDNIDHCRSLTGGRLYDPAYAAQAEAWLIDAKQQARARIALWRGAGG